jgi:Tfp pilus assembly protein PilO
MKIKILLAPAIIVITIVLCIWMVYPAYTDGVNGVKEKYQKLKEQTRLSDNLDKQIGNVGKLSASLKANTSRNSVVFGYIPQDKEEEKIIESLNLLAKDSGLSVLNISVFEMKNEVDPNLNIATPAVAPALSGATSDAFTQPIAATIVTPRKIKTDLVVLGDYGGVKVLVEKIQKMNRFNKFSALEIRTLLKEDQTVSESLSVKMTLEFNYLKELDKLAEQDIDNPIFSTGAFDMQVIDNISKNKSIEVKNVLPGQKGTANPFLMIK